MAQELPIPKAAQLLPWCAFHFSWQRLHNDSSSTRTHTQKNKTTIVLTLLHWKSIVCEPPISTWSSFRPKVWLCKTSKLDVSDILVYSVCVCLCFTAALLNSHSHVYLESTISSIPLLPPPHTRKNSKIQFGRCNPFWVLRGILKGHWPSHKLSCLILIP